MKPKSNLNISAIASRYGVTTRTVNDWRRAGAPLADPKRLATWLAGRKQSPAPRIAEPPAPPAIPADLGAAAALKRLETAEADAYARLESATKGGDPLEIRAARLEWLKISESLRRYDLQVEAARRDSGQLVPRPIVVELLTRFGWSLIWSMRGFEDCAPLVVGCKDAREAWEVLHRPVENFHIAAQSAMSLLPAQSGLPDWLRDAFTKALHRHPGDDVNVEVVSKALRMCIAELARQEKEVRQ